MTEKVEPAIPRHHRGGLSVPDQNLVRVKYQAGGVVSVDPYTADKHVNVDKTAKLFPLSEFDADFSPNHPTNQKAAAAHGLRFDKKKQSYVDVEGNLVRDKFGQPY